ncbi:MAG TPA: DUF1501 domain-containing protein [Acidimicrobiales bacterium]|nr:DUF1501 domain-containing protein [Acidimicrobiales bacterium]
MTDDCTLTRRRLLAGAAATGLATLAAPLVDVRAAFGDPAATGTLVVVFLRGGMDGLSAVVPADDPHLAAARPGIGVPTSTLLPLDRGFGLHPALAPLHELWTAGRFTAVPAVSTPDISRSHFQAQDCLERGGSSAGAVEGWLDRVLDVTEPGAAFQAVTVGPTLARALAGDQGAVALPDVDAFALHAGGDDADRYAATTRAITALHEGLDHPLAADVATALDGLGTAALVSAAGYQPAAEYPEGDLGHNMAEVARLIKAGIGLRIACVDVGGWDMHVDLGTVDGGAMQRELTTLGGALAAFATDLGGEIDRVTVIVMTEFGRRVEQNANGGTDHGHGATVLLLGGGLAGGTVHGTWQGLAPDVLEQGDVPGWNDYRDLLAEVAGARLGVAAGDMATVFPGHRVQHIGVMR